MHLLHKNGKKSSLFNRAKISLFETQSPYFKTQISLFGPKKISHVWDLLLKYNLVHVACMGLGSEGQYVFLGNWRDQVKKGKQNIWGLK